MIVRDALPWFLTGRSRMFQALNELLRVAFERSRWPLGANLYQREDNLTGMPLATPSQIYLLLRAKIE
jgi:hypothetical protein